MKRQIATLSLILLLFGLAGPARAMPFAGDPIANAMALNVVQNIGLHFKLSGSQVDMHPLTYAIASSPTHGTLTLLNAVTGDVSYQPNASYTGSDSFTFHVTACPTGSYPCGGGATTSSDATVTLNVVASKTVINGQVASAGTVTFVLVKRATSFDGVALQSGYSVTAATDGTGHYTVSLYPTAGLNPPSYWQLSFKSTTGTVSSLGLYNVPISSAAIDQSTLDLNLVASLSQNSDLCCFPTSTAINAVVSGMGALVTAAQDAQTAAVSAAATAHNYDLVAFNPGVTTPTQIVVVIPANRSFTLALTGSTCSALAAATAQTDFLVQYSSNSGSSWTTKATLRFAAAGKTCSVVSPTSTPVSSGDWIQIVGPGTPDATLANISFNLKGNLP